MWVLMPRTLLSGHYNYVFQCHGESAITVEIRGKSLMDRLFIILTNGLLSVAYNAQKLAPQCQKGKSPVSPTLMLIVL